MLIIVNKGTSLYIENIQSLDSENDRNCPIVRMDSANFSLTMKNCTFQTQYPMVDSSSDGGRFEFVDCTFMSSDCVLYQDGPADVTITNCLFERCGRIASDFEDDLIYEEFVGNSHAVTLKGESVDVLIGSNLKCIGNVFKDCPTHPIVEDIGYDADELHVQSYHVVENEKYILCRDNILNGNNQLQYNGHAIDPNSVYRTSQN